MAQIVVIGAGMGAMAAAARLAVAGHQVAVYERGSTYGGAVGSLSRDGFAFDTGPGLLHLPAVYRDLFVKTGRQALADRVSMCQVEPGSRHLFPDGTDLRLPNASRAGVLRALDEAFGQGAGDRWSELISRAREVWDATRRPLLEEPLPADWAALTRDPYPGARRRRWGRSVTLAETAVRELGDRRAVALLESHALAHGLDPRSAPASATVLAYIEQTFGSWYVHGGIRALADALHQRCRERRVAFHFDRPVTGLLADQEGVSGVELADGSRVAADTVVAGIDPRRLPEVTSGGGSRWSGELWDDGQVRPADVAPAQAGRFMVFLALRGPRPTTAAARTVVHTDDRDAELRWVFPAAGRRRGRRPANGAGYRPTVTVRRPDDRTLVPDAGHEAVTLSAPAPPHAPDGGGVDWRDEALVARYAQRVLATAEAALPGLAERTLWREVRTPADTADDTGAVAGAVPAPALAGAAGRLLAVGNRTRLPGLWLAGGWAHPGGGLAAAGMSGALVAGLIVNGPDWHGSA